MALGEICVTEKELDDLELRPRMIAAASAVLSKKDRSCLIRTAAALRNASCCIETHNHGANGAGVCCVKSYEVSEVLWYTKQ